MIQKKEIQQVYCRISELFKMKMNHVLMDLGVQPIVMQ